MKSGLTFSSYNFLPRGSDTTKFSALAFDAISMIATQNFCIIEITYLRWILQDSPKNTANVMARYPK